MQSHPASITAHDDTLLIPTMDETTSTSKAKVKAGTSTTSQRRSWLKVHILGSIPQMGFNVTSPERDLSFPLLSHLLLSVFWRAKTLLVDICVAETGPVMPRMMLCCGRGKHTPEKQPRCTTDTAQQQKSFWKPCTYCRAAFIPSLPICSGGAYWPCTQMHGHIKCQTVSLVFFFKS